MDDQPEENKLNEQIKEAHRIVKSRVSKTEDVWIKAQIVKAAKASSTQLNTAENRKFSFRQGAACEF